MAYPQRALALLPEPHRRPHALHRLLETLPQSPADSALVTLERLAVDNPAFLQKFEWMNALIKLDTEAAALVVLARLCEGRIQVRDGFRLSGALTGWACKYPAVHAAMIARYRSLPAGNIRTVLEMAMDVFRLNHRPDPAPIAIIASDRLSLDLRYRSWPRPLASRRLVAAVPRADVGSACANGQSRIGGQPPSPLARCRAHYGIYTFTTSNPNFQMVKVGANYLFKYGVGSY